MGDVSTIQDSEQVRAVRPQSLWDWPGNGRKLLLAMVHLKGEGETDVLDRARRECDIFREAGFDGVVVENYFGTVDDVRRALPVLKEEYPELHVGVDVIWQNDLSFDLALEFDLPFIELDSIAGHLAPPDEPSFEERIGGFRCRIDTLILGGVRLKNQPYLSGNDLETDLKIAMTRGDGIIVTGNDTGLETDLDKVKEFRSLLGDFSLVVGAGVRIENCVEQMAVADGAIIGSSLKSGGHVTGEVEKDRAVRLANAVREAYPGA